MKTILTEEMLEGPKIKGSRFIGYIFHVQTLQDIEKKIHLVHQQHPQASHVCYAWVLEENQERCFDDGEPRGSAGIPILQYLKGQNLIYILAVSVRYFGGQKLGVGGLIRAYGNSIGLVLEKTQFQEYIPIKTIEMTYDYDLNSAVKKVLAGNPNLYVQVQHCYTHHVQSKIEIPIVHEQEIKLLFIEACSGRILFS